MPASLRKILEETKTIAVVGLSPDPAKPSHQVAAYLKSQGYCIIPVNPKATEILEEKCYPNLASLPQSVDVVEIFRRSEDVLPIVEEAIRLGAKVIWMQEGIINHEAAERATEAGLQVVMDHCMKREHLRTKLE